jgi:hypothetical protein
MLNIRFGNAELHKSVRTAARQLDWNRRLLPQAWFIITPETAAPNDPLEGLTGQQSSDEPEPRCKASPTRQAGF